MSKTKKIKVKGSDISIIEVDNKDFISLSDMVKSFEGKSALIEQWLRNKDTVEFLGIWEQINNPIFNSLEFEGIKNASGTNRFYLSAKKWIKTTGAIGLIAKAGRYGGTFAHKDIAFEFGSWLSAEFKLYLIKEFQRLKDDENNRLKLNWDLQRTISKINYHIHTDAIKDKLLPPKINNKQKSRIYASEADILNVALFGQTAKEWRNSHSEIKGNIRDYASLEQLVVLSNLESINAIFINNGLSQHERLVQLNEIAISQLSTLFSHKSIKKLK